MESKNKWPIKQIADAIEIGQPCISILEKLIIAAEEIHSKLKINTRWGLHETGFHNATGDVQTTEDLIAERIIEDHLTGIEHLGYYASEEKKKLTSIGTGKYGVSIDPFDGSKAYLNGIPPGMIFGMFSNGSKPEDFTGNNLKCSGVFVFSNCLELIISGKTKVIVARKDGFEKLRVPTQINEILICVNLSNADLWSPEWREYFTKKLLNQSITDTRNNLRWFGSLATHIKTLAVSGGLFAYPPDTRSGNHNGHLRLVYEAIPVALIIENLGGRATNGTDRILDILPKTIHQKTPLVMGDTTLVNEIKSILD